jgi:hypothetical protein
MSDKKQSEQMELDLGLNGEAFSVDLSSFSGDDYIYNGSNSNTITLDHTFSTSDFDISDDAFTINTSFEEWVDTMPSIHKIKGMCEQYPAFQKEFEKFRQMYNLIKDDYEAKYEDEDELPF